MGVSDAELDDAAGQVRAMQRRNWLVRGVSVIVCVSAIAAGVGLQSLGNSWRGGLWLGVIVGVIAGGTILKKFEVRVDFDS